MNDKLLDHEKRISRLENNYSQLEVKLANVEANQLKLENTILHEGKETRSLLNKIIEHNHSMEKLKHESKQSLLTKFLAWLGGIWVVIQLAIKLWWGGE